MTHRIIFKQDDGTVAVIVPSDEALAKHTMMEIAKKDVPAGKAFKIIPVADVPSDRYFRNAWDANDVDLNDGVGADSNSF